MRHPSPLRLLVSMIAATALLVTAGCKKNEAPRVQTVSASVVTESTAMVAACVTDAGSSGLLETGICWDTTGDPTVNDHKVTGNPAGGDFTATLTGLLPGTTCFVRAYATNRDGTGYGIVKSFNVPLLHGRTLVADVDGNIYHTVTIGTQTWLVENLRVEHYRNGDPIPFISDNNQWTNTTSGAYCYVNNSPAYTNDYGLLYNWFTVNDPRGIAPLGWHVPSDAEWDVLITYLGGTQAAGMQLKEEGFAHWDQPNTGASNKAGFRARGAGLRNYDGAYMLFRTYAEFWSTTPDNLYNAWGRHVSYNTIATGHPSNNKLDGLSVRCIKD